MIITKYYLKCDCCQKIIDRDFIHIYDIARYKTLAKWNTIQRDGDYEEICADCHKKRMDAYLGKN